MCVQRATVYTSKRKKMKYLKETMVIFFSFMAGVFHYMILTTFGLWHWITILMTIAVLLIMVGGISMILPRIE